MIIDSGSTINLIDKASFNRLNSQPVLKSTRTNIFAYKSTTPLKLEGVFKAALSANGKTTQSKIFLFNYYMLDHFHHLHMQSTEQI